MRASRASPFAVWAPNARRVSVVGDFNGWDGRRMPMRRRHAGGFWEIFVPGLRPGHLYKYEILGADGQLLPLKADPACRAGRAAAGHRLDRRARRRAMSGRTASWMAERWRPQRPRGADLDLRGPSRLVAPQLAERGRYLTYRELAEQLVPYVADLGFTHIEVLPVTEYPFDGSWGYQPISLFAPTSRFGAPDDFRAFVDACHRAGLGLLLDWVPGHFPTDAHGLGRFDGTALYEHADPRQGLHRDWNTLIYNYGRREVANFLLSSALYWLREFHIDGHPGRCRRLDALPRLQPQGGRVDPERLRRAREPRRDRVSAPDERTGVRRGHRRDDRRRGIRPPGRWCRARSMSAGSASASNGTWGGCTTRCSYMSRDPIHRKYHHNDLTFGLLYAFHENFILPLSHDEVVHGKGSLIGKMPGDRWQRFANLRAYFAFMWTHPGKKLLFMGGEFGQEREWNHDIGLDWQLARPTRCMPACSCWCAT